MGRTRRLVVAVLVAVAVLVPQATPAGADPNQGVVATPLSVGGTYVPVVGNFLGDGVGSELDEVLWYRPGPLADYLWSPGSNGFADRSSTTLDIDHAFTPHVGDFDQDRLDDILWVNEAGADPVWYAEGDGTWDVRSWNVPSGARILVGDYLRTMSDTFGQDEVFAYRPGPANDPMFVTQADRSAPTVVAFSVTGTYQPFVMRNASDPPFPDAIHWYAPGGAADFSWEFESCPATACRTSYPFAVSGTYQVISDVVLRCGADSSCSNGVIWYAPGAAKDYAWAGWKAGENPPTPYPVNVSGTYAPLRVGDEVIVWRSAGAADPVWRWNFTTRAFEKGTYPVNVGSDLIPVVGGFNGSNLDRDDVLWYGPGSKPDTQVLTSGQLS